jgi:FixJ family two-component response regulator
VSRASLIAVIDDDTSCRLALADSLRSLGYEAREFASAEEFISGDEDRFCDCVITDIHMPGMSGFELSRVLAARDSAVPVIMITALRGQGLENKAKASGSVGLLKKPFQSDALVGYLQRALRN